MSLLFLSPTPLPSCPVNAAHDDPCLPPRHHCDIPTAALLLRHRVDVAPPTTPRYAHHRHGPSFPLSTPRQRHCASVATPPLQKRHGKPTAAVANALSTSRCQPTSTLTTSRHAHCHCRLSRLTCAQRAARPLLTRSSSRRPRRPLSARAPACSCHGWRSCSRHGWRVRTRTAPSPPQRQ